jgi:hypothetical protein
VCFFPFPQCSSSGGFSFPGAGRLTSRFGSLHHSIRWLVSEQKEKKKKKKNKQK